MTGRNRVPDHTSACVNEKILYDTKKNIRYYVEHPDEINERLRELDREWDIERVLEIQSSVLSLIGITIGLARNPRWLLLPLAVQTFFLQHALQGWCPPMPILRRMGVRTVDEINYERYSLKALRGDFSELSSIDESKGAAHIAAETIHLVTS